MAATNKCLARSNKPRHVIDANNRNYSAELMALEAIQMNERYPRIYRLLKDAGHYPAKAVELLLDAKRGDEWALIWIRVLRRNRKVNVVSEGRRCSSAACRSPFSST